MKTTVLIVKLLERRDEYDDYLASVGKVHEHKILKDLMMGELQVLEDTSHPNVMRI